MRQALPKSAFNFPANGGSRQKSLQTLPPANNTYSTLFLPLLDAIDMMFVIIQSLFTVFLIFP